MRVVLQTRSGLDTFSPGMSSISTILSQRETQASLWGIRRALSVYSRPGPPHLSHAARKCEKESLSPLIETDLLNHPYQAPNPTAPHD